MREDGGRSGGCCRARGQATQLRGQVRSQVQLGNEGNSRPLIAGIFFNGIALSGCGARLVLRRHQGPAAGSLTAQEKAADFFGAGPVRRYGRPARKQHGKAHRMGALRKRPQWPAQKSLIWDARASDKSPRAKQQAMPPREESRWYLPYAAIKGDRGAVTSH